MEHNACTIGALGLSDAEVKVLKSLASLTSGRAQGSYVVGVAPESSDVVIVNADDAAAMAAWQALATTPNPPVLVTYGQEKPADPSVKLFLLRPFGPAKLLALLDGIAGELQESAKMWKKSVSSQPAKASVAQLKALVIDDSPTVCTQLELELRNFNIQSTTADTGEKGLELLAQQAFDLIFLDVVLPGTDGYQVCKEIRKAPKTKQTPVVMLTSKSSPFDRVRGTLVGCSAYLTKPVDYNNFRELVGKFVETGAVS